MDDRIDILLATYNGERFLAEQLDSVIAQSHTNWRILARDDGSSDGTVDLLKGYKRQLGDKLDILEDARGNLGLAANFSALMGASDAQYAAFCDQDDVWLPEKLALGLKAVQALELQWGRDTPCLSFSDLEIVDEDLRQVAPSFWHYENLAPDKADRLSRLLAKNAVTGCTTVLNRALITRAAPIPDGIILHDWWVALVAASFGHVEPISQATIKYRQHTTNDTGARRYRIAYFVIGLFKFLHRYVRNAGRQRGIFSHYSTHYNQAETFSTLFREELTPEMQELIAGFLNIPYKTLFTRALFLSKNGIYPRGLVNALAFFCLYNASSMGLARPHESPRRTQSNAQHS